MQINGVAKQNLVCSRLTHDNKKCIVVRETMHVY